MRTGRFQRLVQFQQARRHHEDVGHHLPAPQDAMQSLHEIVKPRVEPIPHELLVQQEAPLTGILERHDLRGAVVALALLKEEVVVARGFEGRIQIDQIHRFIGNTVAQDVQIVAVEECVQDILYPKAKLSCSCPVSPM
jgi:hypothetical protein